MSGASDWRADVVVEAVFGNLCLLDFEDRLGPCPCNLEGAVPL